MKPLRILSVYKWATMGGVERVLLNRAHAMLDEKMNVKYDIHFLHDSGGKEKFIDYINNNGLNQVIEVVDHIYSDKYDLIFSIDTPEIIQQVDPQKVYMECHTSYKRNRGYLQTLPRNIKGILVPSEHFKSELIDELPYHLRDKLQVLSNSVYIKKTIKLKKKIFSKTPILYVGRLDFLKNIEEVIKIVSFYNKHNDELVLVLAGPIIEHEVDLSQLLKKYSMINRTIYLPPLNFEKVWELMQIVKNHNGLFISASLKESFGLSVAEAMRFDLPVVLLNNLAHNTLVQGDERFLIEPNSSEQAVNKIKDILLHYEQSVVTMQNYSDLIQNKFITEWKNILFS